MALKSLIPFPIFAPPNPTHHRPPTEIRFSRWNNANAEKFIRQQRTQKLIEDDLRRLKRFNSAEKIANVHENATAAANDPFRSTGTPSTPSRPSIPGKKSKYSKTPRPNHPAFRRYTKVVRIPTDVEKAETAVTVTDDGVSYVLPNAPFAFQYSYTETPKAKPLKLREPAVAPFGPSTMPRPWTGRKPLPPGKKRVEFDSFRLPPAGKKGVKPVQAPGPFLPGSGPKYVKSREEVLGEPLTKEEVVEMVMACKKTRRQLNMGRDGLTHNMLDNIHALWKRKRVCKIKCKGVCTVDMDNVRQQLEEKTGGKIIYSRGGIIYLFRGRNYNYRTRPQFPLMLWKPVTPVYPRLVQRAPEGLTMEEASEMRKKGRKLIPICKLGKNGVYCDLVKNVKEAFEACELVRINCEGMNGSDYRRIGAKLKDLVPCVLISFEREHILMWRGRDWKLSLPKLVGNSEASGISVAPHLEGQAVTISSISYSEGEGVTTLQTLSSNTSPICSEDVVVLEGEGTSMEADSETKNSEADGAISIDPRMEGQAVAVSIPNSEGLTSLQTLSSSTSPICSADVGLMGGGCTSMEADSEAKNSEADGAISIAPHFEGEEVTALSNPKSEGLTSIQTLRSSTSPICIEDLEVGGGEFTSIEAEDHIPEINDTSSLVVCGSVSNTMNVYGSSAPFTVAGCGGDGSVPSTESHGSNITLHTTGFHNDEATTMSSGDDVSLENVGDPRNVKNTFPVVPITCNELQDSAETLQNVSDPTRLTSPWTEGVLVLWKEAIETGSAVVLNDSSLDADIVYRRAVALAKSAPPGPVFRHRRKKVAVQKREEQRTEDLEAKEVMMVSERGRSDGKRSTYRRLKEIKEEYLNVAPQGSLRVDELAKLLA